MKINEDTVVIYHVYKGNQPIAEFDTRKEANDFIDDRDEHGYDTIMWSVIPEPHYNGD